MSLPCCVIEFHVLILFDVKFFFQVCGFDWVWCRFRCVKSRWWHCYVVLMCFCNSCIRGPVFAACPGPLFAGASIESCALNRRYCATTLWLYFSPSCDLTLPVCLWVVSVPVCPWVVSVPVCPWVVSVPVCPCARGPVSGPISGGGYIIWHITPPGQNYIQ